MVIRFSHLEATSPADNSSKFASMSCVSKTSCRIPLPPGYSSLSPGWAGVLHSICVSLTVLTSHSSPPTKTCWAHSWIGKTWDLLNTSQNNTERCRLTWLGALMYHTVLTESRKHYVREQMITTETSAHLLLLTLIAKRSLKYASAGLSAQVYGRRAVIILCF